MALLPSWWYASVFAPRRKTCAWSSRLHIPRITRVYSFPNFYFDETRGEGRFGALLGGVTHAPFAVAPEVNVVAR